MSSKLVELKFTVTVGTLKPGGLRRCGHGVGPSEEGVVIKTQRKHPVQRGAKTFGWWSRRELGRGAEKPLPYSPSFFTPPANNLYWPNTMGNQQASWCSLCGNRVRQRSVQRRSTGKLSGTGAVATVQMRPLTEFESQLCHKLCCLNLWKMLNCSEPQCPILLK